jgi:hypothetical protein
VTYVCPEAGKPTYEPFIAPFIQTGKLGVHGAPAGAWREEVFERFDDEGRVAVDFSTDCQDGDLSVGNGEGAGQEGTGHHGWDGNVCCGRSVPGSKGLGEIGMTLRLKYTMTRSVRTKRVQV